ncbi:hypothetical protein CRENBAI_022338 [Crenichthys baileyi]|uniref:RRM domain-containing protein n=1 Tax=Crenichthys baileyi TaxID=28760 RepID=A0AAV9RLU1_9TELE
MGELGGEGRRAGHHINPLTFSSWWFPYFEEPDADARPGGAFLEGRFLKGFTLQLDLKDLMRKAGEVTFVDAHRPTKNEGVVEFVSRYDMKNAISKLDGTELERRRAVKAEESFEG